jgi:hypothetical protein
VIASGLLTSDSAFFFLGVGAGQRSAAESRPLYLVFRVGKYFFSIEATTT